jgi:hypothetical protein
MTWRKCLVRGLVCTALGGLLLLGGAYALWTNPSAVRQLVMEQLSGRFVRVAVHLGRARLRLLGGIRVDDLRLARTDGLDRANFLYVPSAVIYHDKEHMLEGKVLVRKVELTGPQLRLIRDRDGRFNVEGVLDPSSLGERLPTVVVRGGTILYEDRALAPGAPLLEVRNVYFTLVNDPLPTLQLEGTGETDVLGPIRFHATLPRATLRADLRIDLPAVPVGADLWRRFTPLCPRAASHLDQLTGEAEVHARLRVNEEGPRPLSYDVSARFRKGRFSHALLPAALDRLEVEARCIDGVAPAATLSARSGKTSLHVRVADLRLPSSKEELCDVHRLMRELDARFEHVEATGSLLDRLPEDLAFIKEDYSPSGPFSLSYAYRKTGAAPARKVWVVEPEGMAGEFSGFRYPLRQVRGKIRIDASAAPLRDISLDVSAVADNHPVTLRGTIKGEKKTGEVILDIRGQDLALDDKVLRALPPRAIKAAMAFLPAKSRRLGLANHPMGKADFHAAIRRSPGQDRLGKRFTVFFKEAELEYDEFPYPLENVSGVLVVHPDHWECKDFRGTHAGGEIFVSGHSERMLDRAGILGEDGVEGAKPEIVRIRIRGQSVLLDKELERALSPAHGKDRKALQAAWHMLSLAGRMSFTAEVVDHPNHPKDIDVTVGVQGCTMKPVFFDYALDDVSGQVRYAQDRVYLHDIRARHGPARLGLRTGLLQLKPGGGFLAWLQGITGTNVFPDQDLLSALPEGLRYGLRPLHLREPLDVTTALTLDAAPGANAPVKVWWDGGTALRNASFSTGVDVKEATGQFWCRGCYDGKRLRGVFGDLMLEKASILGQPLKDLHGRVEVLPDSPDVVRVRDIKAKLFGGSIGGEARLETAPTLRYDVLLEALGVELEQFGKHNLGAASAQAQLQGPVRASLHLQGEGGDLIGLKGNGRVDVSEGKMGQLPVLLDLVKAFGLRVPDRTAFEQADVIFAVEGPRLRVQQLDLFGKAFSLRGEGTVDLDGSNVELDFTATPGLVTRWLPSGVDAIPQLISQQLLKIKMRGRLASGGDVRFDKELAPGVVDPLRRVFGGE